MMGFRRARFLFLPLTFVVACGGTAEDSLTGDGDGDETSGDGDGDGTSGDGDGDGTSGDGDGDGTSGDGDGDGTSGDGDGDGVPAEIEEALEGRTFVLEAAEGYTLVTDTTVSLSFHPMLISFSAGCNGHTAVVAFEGNALIAGEFGSTDIGCETELHEQDEWFAAFFSDRPTVQIDGDRVIFTTDDATLVFLDEEVADDPPPLVGTVWDIWALTEGNSASGGYDVVPTVTFLADGSVIVFSGCATGTGYFEYDQSTITFADELGYQMINCPNAEMASVEAHMQAIFQTGEVTYAFDGQELVIERGDLGVRAQMRP